MAWGPWQLMILLLIIGFHCAIIFAVVMFIIVLIKKNGENNGDANDKIGLKMNSCDAKLCDDCNKSFQDGGKENG